MTLREQIEVMRAALEGKPIQLQLKMAGSWKLVAQPAWNWHEYNYRIKPPEPLVVYANEYDLETPFSKYGVLYTNLTEAIKHSGPPCYKRTIKFQEVPLTQNEIERAETERCKAACRNE